MDNYLYICHNCGKSYIPKRRKIQKYCNNSCRTRAFMLRKFKTGLSIPETKKNEPTKIDKMSIAGVGNAAVGSAIVKFAEVLFTSEANKPATKNDLQILLQNIKNRYYPVVNIPIEQDGSKPFYDIETKSIVYFNP